MKRILALWLACVSVLISSQPALAAEHWECLVKHLRDAITLNRARAATYADLSDGASRPLSRRLVASEMISLAAAHAAEAMARSYWRSDIPILCDDFVPMALTPPQQLELADARPDLSEFEPLATRSVIGRVRRALAGGGFAAAHSQIEDEVQSLSAEPRFHCMARHLLESAARMAWLAPHYDARAERCQSETPACQLAVAPSWLSRAMIEVHLQALHLARDFDQRAAPLAARGIAIICGDVPAIDMRPVVE